MVNIGVHGGVYKCWQEVGNTKSNMGGLHVVFLFIIAALFVVCVLTLFGYHCYLVACNKSTIGSNSLSLIFCGLNVLSAVL